jgi:hypothetical protein
MAGAVAKQEEDAFDARMALPSRSEVLARYRRLREISGRHHDEAMNLLSHDAILYHVRRLGLAFGRTFVCDDPSALTYVLDLAIHTAPAGRTRAIERYARTARLAPESDEALVLKAMCNSRFTVFGVERRHEAAGLIVTDLFRHQELWLVDEAMETSFPEGYMFAARLFILGSFSMTAGVGVPFDAELLEDVLDEVPQLGRKRTDQVADDRRFVEAVYRIAFESGLAEEVVFKRPIRSDGSPAPDAKTSITLLDKPQSTW